MALRLAYIASLRRLEAAGLLVLEKDKTNWEYQRGLRSRSPAANSPTVHSPSARSSRTRTRPGWASALNRSAFASATGRPGLNGTEPL